MRYGPVEAIGHGIARMWRLVKLQVDGLGAVATGELGVDQVSGPVGIANLSGKVASAGLTACIEFVALMSVAIGVMNLVPVPGLDGGHMLILTLEALIGRDFSEKAKTRAVQAGFVLLMLLMIVALNNDIGALLK